MAISAMRPSRGVREAHLAGADLDRAAHEAASSGATSRMIAATIRFGIQSRTSLSSLAHLGQTQDVGGCHEE
jgi:hypothetical protein